MMAKARWLGLIVPLVAIAAWTIAGLAGLIDPRLWATPGSVAAAAVDQLSAGDFWSALGASLARDVAGFAIGSVAGLALGAAMGLFSAVDRLIRPLFNGAKQVALFAWIPLMSVWLGTDEVAKIAFIALAALFPVALNTYAGVQAIAPEYREVGRVLCLTRWQTLRRIMLPAAMPSIASGIYLALIYSWLATIGAEYFFSVAPGIGNVLTDARDHFQMNVVVFAMIVIGLVGVAVNHLAERGLASWLRWHAQPD